MKIKNLISLFFVTITACLALSITASAAVDWNTATANSITADTEVIIDDNSTGTLDIRNGATVTVTGNANALNNNLTVSLQSNERLIWNASFAGSGRLIISGVGESVTISGVDITTSSSEPAVEIFYGIRLVTIEDSAIVNTVGTGVKTASNLKFTGNDNNHDKIQGAVHGLHAAGVRIDLGNQPTETTRPKIYSTADASYAEEYAAVYATGSATVNIGVVSINGNNVAGVKLTQDGSTFIPSLNMTNGDVQGRYAINANYANTISISGGQLYSNASGTDKAALHLGDVNSVLISGGDINGNNASGVHILDTGHDEDSDGSGKTYVEIDFVMTGGKITGKNGITVVQAGSINISGGKVYSVNGDHTNAAIYAEDIEVENPSYNYYEIPRYLPITISGTAEIRGRYASTDHADGIFSNNDEAKIYIQGGTVTGINGINLQKAINLDITGGTINARQGNAGNVAAVAVYGETAVAISGTTTQINGNYLGSYNGVHIDNANASLSMTGGTVSGNSGIYLVKAIPLTISGGSITGSGYYAGIFIGGGVGKPDIDITIGGNVAINGGDNGDGISMSQGAVDLFITGGIIQGYNGLEVGSFKSINITGGNLRGNGTLGEGIRITSNGTLTIAPTVSVLVQGISSAMNPSGGGAIVSTAPYYFTGEYFDGTAKTAYKQSVTPFANSLSYKYAEFLTSAPTFTVTVNSGTVNGKASDTVQADRTFNISPASIAGKTFTGWTAAGITLSDPTTAAQTLIMPLNDVTLTAVYETIILGDPNTPGDPYDPGDPSEPEPKPDSEIIDKSSSDSSNNYYNPPAVRPQPGTADTGKKDCILVIATLNKSGSVNSTKTAEDLSEAHKTAVREDISRIFLKIPEGGTGISASTMKKLYKAAGGTQLYLIFDYYDTNKLGEIEVYGYFLVRLNSKTGQILTGLKFETEAIEAAQEYIIKRWDSNILASYETKQKASWGDTATLSISMDKLGFSASEDVKLYALIYDTANKKWYQSGVEISDGNVIVKTKRAGIITIVTDPIK
jgi:hypothetical protein